MSVIRYDLDRCVGCRRCVDICPMDVFRFNEEKRKSVIAYPEDCITCGQCFFYCPANSLAISDGVYGHAINSFRTVAREGMAHVVFTPDEQENT